MTSDDGWHPGAPGFPRREMMSELLPCPFCGCADIRKENCVVDATVWCSSCGALHRRKNLFSKDDGFRLAVSNWNTRFNPAASALPGTEMREAQMTALVEKAMAEWESDEEAPDTLTCAHHIALTILALSPAGQTDSSFDRVATPWDAHHNRTYEPVETRAKEIYDFFEFKGVGTKPAWVPGGNSLKQDEARICARKQLRDAGHTPIPRPERGGSND